MIGESEAGRDAEGSGSALLLDIPLFIAWRE
jgi:hypothetical protein